MWTRDNQVTWRLRILSLTSNRAVLLLEHFIPVLSSKEAITDISKALGISREFSKNVQELSGMQSWQTRFRGRCAVLIVKAAKEVQCCLINVNDPVAVTAHGPLGVSIIVFIITAALYAWNKSITIVEEAGIHRGCNEQIGNVLEANGRPRPPKDVY